MAIRLYKVPDGMKGLVPRGADYACQHLYSLIMEGEELEPDGPPDTPVADIGMYGDNEDKASGLCGECLAEYDSAVTEKKPEAYETGDWAEVRNGR